MNNNDYYNMNMYSLKDWLNKICLNEFIINNVFNSMNNYFFFVIYLSVCLCNLFRFK